MNISILKELGSGIYGTVLDNLERYDQVTPRIICEIILQS